MKDFRGQNLKGKVVQKFSGENVELNNRKEGQSVKYGRVGNRKKGDD